MSEKIIQITSCTAAEGVGGDAWEALYALTDTGNVYYMTGPQASEEYLKWQKLPPPPERSDEE